MLKTARAKSPAREESEAPARPRRMPAVLLPDALLALAITGFALLDIVFDLDNSTRYGPMPPLVVSTLVATLMLALRRLAPLATAVVVAVAIAGPMLATPLTFTLWGDFLPLLLATYSVARHGERVSAWLGVAATATTVVLVMLRNPDAGTVSNIPFAAVPIAIVFVAGRVLSGRARSHSDDQARVQRLEAEREEAIHVALVEERSRIARELHDIVAHCVSVMVVQAGAAEDLLDRDPSQAHAPLRSVQETGHQAVGELGRMLGLLRGEATRPALKPQPGTANLAELIEHMGGVGLPVSLTMEGPARPLPPGMDLTVYRVVQEALTNALKHATPTTAHVLLHYDEQSIRVSVRDTGRTGSSASPASNRIGHGLLGMRERVGLYGGTLETGHADGGGFAVTASLPLQAAPR
ncbi:sensor histidine kinase [Streptomyces sp. CB01373]|uniref:sensor histidine kinase n=1 Tax=Streptomyces sp. CB01373 TaxID=2020325 RepID=UPI000C27A24C|nr:sensor histidine kinase [Streptomyces sp. CB01373]PJM92779.1 two-component sensor histidine kinase [Streptomyces sp. CB01373]